MGTSWICRISTHKEFIAEATLHSGVQREELWILHRFSHRADQPF
jgi:hypothetical protein